MEADWWLTNCDIANEIGISTQQVYSVLLEQLKIRKISVLGAISVGGKTEERAYLSISCPSDGSRGLWG